MADRFAKPGRFYIGIESSPGAARENDHMADALMAQLWAGLLATSPLEAVAVLLSLLYVVLAVPRSRWCWVAGGVGSLIYVWLFARARLPMQSLLQVWYVVRRLWLPALVARGYDAHLAAIVARPRRSHRRVAAAGFGHRAFPGRGNAGTSMRQPWC